MPAVPGPPLERYVSRWGGPASQKPLAVATPPSSPGAKVVLN